jgi:hypothetical protein
MATSSPQGLSRWPVQAWSSVLSSCISTRWPCSSDSWCPGFPSARRVENRRVRHGCWICSSCFPPQSVWVSYGSHICARSQSVVDERKAGQEYRGRPEGDRSRQSPVRRSGERCGLLLLRGRTHSFWLHRCYRVDPQKREAIPHVMGIALERRQRPAVVGAVVIARECRPGRQENGRSGSP